MAMSVSTQPLVSDSRSPRVVHIRSGVPVEPLVTAARSPELFSDVITRVEWDAMVSAGRDPFQWYARLPRYQRLMPQGVVTDEGCRFRVSANLTVIY
jgi:hypothetical protein